MTALYCFIDQRIASILYSHYSKNLSLYKCCLAKFGCTTVIVILQIIFNRQCFLRKQPLERMSDIEMSYPQESNPTVVQPSSSQTSNTTPTPQPSHYRKKHNNSRQTFATFNNQTPSFNIRSGMKSTPTLRDTQSQFKIEKRKRANNRESDSDINFDAIERHYTVWFYPFVNNTIYNVTPLRFWFFNLQNC